MQEEKQEMHITHLLNMWPIHLHHLVLDVPFLALPLLLPCPPRSGCTDNPALHATYTWLSTHSLDSGSDVTPFGAAPSHR